MVASKLFASTRSSASTSVVFTPISLNCSAISAPMYPAPITTADFALPARSLIAIAWSQFLHSSTRPDSSASSSPSIGGTTGAEPVVITSLSYRYSPTSPVLMSRARNTLPATSTSSTSWRMCIVAPASARAFGDE